ncbi:MAG: hypothetical protein PHI56_05655 [Victivallaceae bacterium]|nr:hypothetical protein [Victivallaceae bacterium]MDD5664256.1 hypothetical protein [Victivallaceae bacterium]
MQIEFLRSVLGWCSVINGGLLFITFLCYVLAGDFIFRIHSKWFPLSKESFTLMMYGFIGGMKLLFIFFNLVPYLALVICG